MHKLSDDQLVEKVRAANRRRSERQRARRVSAGRMAFTVWIPATLQRQIADIATAESATTSAIAERLFIAGINALAETARNSPVEAQGAPVSLPLFEPVSTEAEPPLTCINADLNSLVEGGSVKGEPDKAAPGALTGRDDLIVRLHLEGRNKTEIAKKLFALGWKTDKGNPLSRDTIGIVIKRHAEI